MQISNNTIVVPAQIADDASYLFELEIGIVDDDILEMNEVLTVSVDPLTRVRVLDDSILNATIVILDDDGMCIISM